MREVTKLKQNQPYNYWNELDALFEIADQYGKKAAVMETGYTTYKYGGLPLVDYPNNETKQRNFINTAIPAIKEKADKHSLLFVTWYELIDEPNAGPLPAEKEFGIIYSNFTPKLGYNDLKYQFETIQYFANITSPTQSFSDYLLLFWLAILRLHTTFYIFVHPSHCYPEVFNFYKKWRKE